MLEKFKTAVTSKAGRQILVLQKHSPQMLFATGVVTFGATIFFAVKATMKLDEVLEEGQKELLDVESTTFAEDEQASKAKTRTRLEIAIKVAKLYAPAAGLGLVSIAALTGSHTILNRRNVGLTAAYAALGKGFKEYQERVRAEYGDDKEKELRYGMVDKEIAVETDKGTTTKTVKAVPKGAKSPYAKCFDEQSRMWSPEHLYNQTLLRSQQNYANDLLRSRGHVFLNEVYDMLGLDRTPEGQQVGWVLDNPKNAHDNYIDFGIFNDSNEFMGQMFVNGDEKSVWLDFNVDGVVLDLI